MSNRELYGYEHKKARKAWQRRLNAGETVQCASKVCKTPGAPIDPRVWDLGHEGTNSHGGPEHRPCNRATLTHAKVDAAAPLYEWF